MLVSLNIPKDKKYVVAVGLSGGADSMALLHYLFTNSESLNISVLAVNVEHGIRGEASKKDSSFAKNYCSALGAPFLGYSVDAPSFAAENNLSIEEAARILRYRCFEDALLNKSVDYIATAHHKSDNAETVLFNLFRGASLSGVVGIGDRGKFLRPFINVTKEEISEYVAENRIPFVTDESNFDDNYTRNHLRLNVIPEIKKVFPEAENAVTRFAEIAKKEDEYLDRLAMKALTFEKNVAFIPIDTDEVLFYRAAKNALVKLGISKDYEKAHLDSVYSLISLNNGEKVCLPKGLFAAREYDNVVIYRPEYRKVTPVPFKIGFNQTEIGVIEAIKTSDSDLKSGFFIDLDKLPKNAVIRTRKEGDLFTKFGGGTKKLNDYFTDIKVPNRLRDQILLIASDNIVFYLQNIAVSDKLRVDKTTVNVVKLK